MAKPGVNICPPAIVKLRADDLPTMASSKGPSRLEGNIWDQNLLENDHKIRRCGSWDRYTAEKKQSTSSTNSATDTCHN